MNKRNKVIAIRLTEEEHEQLLARKNKARLAEWLRELALSQKPEKAARKVDPELLFQLNKIGVNMNQIAKFCNQRYVTPTDMIKVLSALARIEEQLEESLANAR